MSRTTSNVSKESPTTLSKDKTSSMGPTMMKGDTDKGPTHHLHKDSEALPGAKGSTPTVDYTPDKTEHTRSPPSEGDAQQYMPKSDQYKKPLDSNFNNTDEDFDYEGASGPTMEHKPFGAQHLGASQKSGSAKLERERRPYELMTDEGSGKLTDIGHATDFTTSKDLKDTTRKPMHQTGVGPTTTTGLTSDDTHNNAGVKPAQHTKPGYATNNPFESGHKDVGAKPYGTTAGGDYTDSTTKPGVGDKILGKTEKLAGKIARNPELEQKGATRSELSKN